MQKYSLLEMVQFILNDMSGDNVNSIDDTSESEQVANIVKQNYYAMLSVGEWPHLRKLARLNPSTDVDRPALLVLPDDVMRILDMRYNKKRPNDDRSYYLTLRYKEPSDFLTYTNSRNTTDDYVMVQHEGADILILTDRPPTYWTSFNDREIVLDSYDSEVEATLQESNTQAHYEYIPKFLMDDDYVPDLPAGAFTQLLEQSKSNAFTVLKGAMNPDAEYKASRSRRWNARKAWKTTAKPNRPNYGRK